VKTDIEIDPALFGCGVLNEATRTICSRMARELDANIVKALERHGFPTIPEELKGRLTRAMIRGDVVETYCVDGVPIMRVWPIETTWAGHVVTASQKVLHL